MERETFELLTLKSANSCVKDTRQAVMDCVEGVYHFTCKIDKDDGLKAKKALANQC